MADPFNQFITWAGNNEPIVLGAAVIGFLLWQAVQKIDDRAFKDYKPKALEDRVIPSLRYRINTLGKECGKKLKIGDFNEIGNIHKYRDMELPENKKITINQESKEEKEKEVEVEEVRAYLITPEKRLQKILWYITDILFNQDRNTDILVFYKERMEEEYDYHKAVGSPQFKNKGGVLLEKGTATDNVVNSIAKDDAEEAVWEGIPNYVEKINHLMPQHSTKIGEKKAEKEDDDDLL